MSHVFKLDEYIYSLSTKPTRKVQVNTKRHKAFSEVCSDVLDHFNSSVFQHETQDDNLKILERQRNAIIGEKREVDYFKSEIRNFLQDRNLMGLSYPGYYLDIVDAIFQEVWGLAGISPWLNMKDSSAAKIIGDRIYFLINGHMELQEQKISKERFEQLKKALLLKTPTAKSNLPYYEVYLNTGERITIYTNEFTKEGQDIMVFRKYLVQQYSFDNLAEMNTIPKESVRMFENLAASGFNAVFSGAVGTGKTTFLTAWQAEEDTTLEGVMVETDPEIPIHAILPTAPIMQLISDNEDLGGTLVKKLMRSDADYLIMAESRDGHALNLAIEMANRGTRRSKTTVHLTDIEDICYDIAQKVINDVGGELDYTLIKVAKSFHYVVELIKLPDKSQKRVKGVYEIHYDSTNFDISIHQIMKYDIQKDDWTFFYDVSDQKEQIALEENYEAFVEFKKELKRLADEKPMIDKDRVIIPFYSRILKKKIS